MEIWNKPLLLIAFFNSSVMGGKNELGGNHNGNVPVGKPGDRR